MQKTVNIMLSLHDGELRIDCENADDNCEIMSLPENVQVTLNVYGPDSIKDLHIQNPLSWLINRCKEHREYDGWIDPEKTVGGPAVYRWYGKQDCCF